MHKALFVSFLLLIVGCTYGPERTVLSIDNAVAKPHSHEFAIAVGYKRLQDSKGAINTFPNGGIPKILYREARIYIVNIDEESVLLVAQVPDYGGIPQPKAVWIDGWSNGKVYFSLRGYGGDQRHGDDLSDKRIIRYSVSQSGELVHLKKYPFRLDKGKNTGPIDDPPFLRLSKGHLSIDIGIDNDLSKAKRKARISLDPETGTPSLVWITTTKHNKANSADAKSRAAD